MDWNLAATTSTDTDVETIVFTTSDSALAGQGGGVVLEALAEEPKRTVLQNTTTPQENNVGASGKKRKKKKRKKKGGGGCEDLLRHIEVVFETESGGALRMYPPQQGCTSCYPDVISFDLRNLTGRVVVRQAGAAMTSQSLPQDQNAPMTLTTGAANPVVAAERQSDDAELLFDANMTPPEKDIVHLNQVVTATQVEAVTAGTAAPAAPAAAAKVDPPASLAEEESQQVDGKNQALVASSYRPVYPDALRLSGSATASVTSQLTGTSTLFSQAQGGIRRLRNKRSILRRSVGPADKHDKGQGDDDDDGDGCDDVAAVTTTTWLHQLCALPKVTLQELERALAREPDAASTRDANGCLPLHILSGNDALVSESTQGREVATKFCWILMRAFPDAITALDNLGYMPFTKAIESWMYWVYERHQNQANSENFFSSVVRSRGGGTSRSQQSCVELDGTSESLFRYSVETFPVVQLYNEVEWCFSMLSLAMDGLGGRDGGFHEEQRRLFQGEDKLAREELARHLVTKLPTLLKTVLLVEDDGNSTRQKLLKMTVFRRCLLCPESVGRWLIVMMRQKGIPSQRAVDYLHLISALTVEDYVGGFANLLTRDVEGFEKARKDVFRAVAALNGPLISLLILDEQEQERAVGACVIWYVMQTRLMRPFVVNIVLVDFVLHLVVLIAYRSFLELGYPVSGTFLGWSAQALTRIVILLTCIHYCIRKFCECASIFAISKRAFLSYMTSLWTILDLLTIVLTFVAVMSLNEGWYEDFYHLDHYSIGFFTVVLGLLWIKILSFLKVVNRAMAAFIIVLIRILRKMKYFALVLMVIVLMFGDMFHYVVSNQGHGVYCQDRNGTLNDPAVDFCSRNVGHSYLRVYALLLGDFELNDWREPLPVLILWIMFTVVGIIVMLNVLIAVFSTSYEEACARSFLIFGRARIAFVAQSYSLEKYLRPKSPCRQTNHRWCLLDVVSRVLRHAMLMSLLFTTGNAEIYLFWRITYLWDERRYIYSLFAGVLFSVLSFSNLVIAVYSLEFWLKGCAPKAVGRVSNILGKCSACIIEVLASKLFGLGDIFDPDGDGIEGFRSRLK